MAVRSRRAVRDINRIVSSLLRRSRKPLTINEWLTRLTHYLDGLGPPVLVGTSHDDVRKRLRSVSFENYVIYFLTTEPDWTIVRVVHGARDFGPEDLA